MCRCLDIIESGSTRWVAFVQPRPAAMPSAVHHIGCRTLLASPPPTCVFFLFLGLQGHEIKLLDHLGASTQPPPLSVTFCCFKSDLAGP